MVDNLIVVLLMVGLAAITMALVAVLYGKTMQHKGVSYSVVQSANPTGWRWIVELLPPQRTRTGDAFTKALAVRRAIAAIDKLEPRIPK
jgi:hypothetical protein